MSTSPEYIAKRLKQNFTIEAVQAYAYNSQRPETDGKDIYLNCPALILEAFKKLLSGSAILGASYTNPYSKETEMIPSVTDELSACHLQLLARNEQVNVDGVMNTKLYNGLLSDDKIARLRCLVKATTVSGPVLATHTGGYRHKRLKFSRPVKNILIDQAGLQWQDDLRNTGGMHFYPDEATDPRLPKDYLAWQNEMYQAIYGTKRSKTPSANFLSVTWNGIKGRLDLDSVANALAVEFSQALEACVFQSATSLKADDKINFKFNRAGMGFFASGLENCNKSLLRVARLNGIEMALKKIADLSKEEQSRTLGKIGRIVLPHSDEPPYSDEVLARIGTLVESLGLAWGGAPEEDTFKVEAGYINATTNCADPHAMPGNEGGPCSVDACVSYNANVNHHNATYNKKMQVRISPQFDFITTKASSHRVADEKPRMISPVHSNGSRLETKASHTSLVEEGKSPERKNSSVIPPVSG